VIAAKGEVPASLTGPCGYQSASVRAARERLPPGLRAGWIDWRLAAPVGRNLQLADILEPDSHVRWRSDAQTGQLMNQMAPLHRQRLEAAAAAGRTVGAVFRRTRAGIPQAEIRLDGLAGCLRTPRGGSSRQMILVAGDGPARSRFLTAREGARLMGLADDYVLPPSQSAGLKVVGDGVNASVVAWLAGGLLEPLLAATARAAA
jgi:DNA (cytosine-5)-methyltransferase 1